MTSRRKRWLILWGFDALRALAVAAVLLVAHWYVEQRPLGAYLNNFEYALLQQALISEFAAARPLHSKDPQIPVVIDISSIRLDKSQPTDRDKLDGLIGQLEEMNAAAIGVDIDFSPDDQGRFVTPKDPQLFIKWVPLGNVRVGVFRREGDEPGRWLGRPEFRPLAAGMMLPEADSNYAYHYSSRTDFRSPADDLLEMPAALFAVLHPGPGPGSVQDRHLIRTVVDGKIRLGEYPIDYSVLDQIQRIPYHDRGDLKQWEDTIARHSVLIGDLRDTADSRCTAHRREPIPGVLIHACSLATLSRGLLWHIDGATSLLCDLGLLFVIVAATGFVRHIQVSVRRLSSINAHAMEILTCGCASLAVLAVSLVFVQITHFFWPDFLWIFAGYFLHPYLREVFGVTLIGIRGFFSAAVTPQGISNAH